MTIHPIGKQCGFCGYPLELGDIVCQECYACPYNFPPVTPAGDRFFGGFVLLLGIVVSLLAISNVIGWLT